MVAWTYTFFLWLEIQYYFLEFPKYRRVDFLDSLLSRLVNLEQLLMLSVSIKEVHSLILHHGSIVSLEIFDFSLEFVDFLFMFPSTLKV